jgi:hypothetical protein
MFLERSANLLARIKALTLDTDATKVIAQLYPILTTLDGKANGLLRVNSLFLTVVLAIFGWIRFGTSGVSFQPILYPLAAVVLATLGVSSLFCMWIVKVSWPFLGRASKNETGGYAFDKEIASLARAANWRTVYYRVAWFLALIGFLALAALAAMIVTDLRPQ